MKIYCKYVRFGKGRPGWNRSVTCENRKGCFSFPLVSGKGVATGVFSDVDFMRLSGKFPANGEIEMSDEELKKLIEQFKK